MNKSLSFSLIFSSAALIVSIPQAVSSRPVAQRLGYPVVPSSRADALVCYMETPQGATLNLESICGVNSRTQNPSATGNPINTPTNPTTPNATGNPINTPRSETNRRTTNNSFNGTANGETPSNQGTNSGGSF